MRVEWQEFANKTRHIRGTCTHCGKFSHYLTQTPQAIEAADGAAQKAAIGETGGLFGEGDY